MRIKQEEMSISYYPLAFKAHVYTSFFVLLAGFTQFSEGLRNSYKGLHRAMGKFYVVVVLFLSATSGFILGIHANGGISSKIAFVLLSVLWFWFTYKAYTSIRVGDIRAHKNFMIRSYALALSAISLRLFKWIIVLILEPHPMDVYRSVAWLGWTVNLAIAEAIIIISARKAPGSSLAKEKPSMGV
ncbi:MAG TPA: DUF2306 domain-containing protein [Bacteroidia bacterium]